MASPLIIWLHGLGDSGAGWSHLKSELGLNGVRYIFPDAPVAPVSCNGGMRMTSWMDLQDIPVTTSNVDDIAGLEASTKVVHEIIDREVANGTPSTSIVLGGFSQGSAMAILAGYSYSKPLAGIVGFSGWAARKGEWGSIVAQGANAQTPAFVAHGEYDNVVEPDCGVEVNELLAKHGVDSVSYSTYAMAHSAHPQQFAALRAWLKDVLKL